MIQNQELFNNRRLFQLLWPLIVEQLLNVLVGMVDVVMVASLGEAAVSGVSLVDALNLLMIQFLAALASGGTVVCSQFIGMKQMKKANESAGQLVLITVCFASVITAICLVGNRGILSLIFGKVEPAVMQNSTIYFLITALSFPFIALYNACASLFRATGNSAVSMKMSTFMNGLNVVGNAFCIYILHMGVAGVAVPTLISRMVAALFLFYLLQKPDNIVRISSFADMKPQKKMIRSILAIGIPGGIESGMFQFGKVMLQSLISTLGTASIAGFAVASNLVTFLYLPGNALGLGLTTIVGQCVGAGEAEQAKAYTRKLVILNYIFLFILASALGFGRYFWIGIYKLSPDSARIASGLVLSHSIAMIIWPLAFLRPYALRAANDAKFTMVSSITIMWVFRVLLAYLFVGGMHLSIQYVWIAMYIDWVARVFVWQWRFRGYTERVRQLKF